MWESNETNELAVATAEKASRMESRTNSMLVVMKTPYRFDPGVDHKAGPAKGETVK